MNAHSKLKESHSVRVSIADLTGRIPKMSELVEIFKSIPAEPTMRYLCNIATSNCNENPHVVEAHLRAHFLDQTLVRTIQIKEHHANVKSIVFNIMTLNWLIDICRHHSPKASDFKTAGEIWTKIGEAFLIANYFVNMPEVTGTGDPGIYAQFSLREGIFNEQEQIRYSIGRAQLIYSLLYNQVSTKDQFDVNGFLQKHFDFSLEDYLQTIIILNAHWGVQCLDKWDPSKDLIDKATYFKGPTDYEQILKVLNRLTQNWKSYNSNPIDVMNPDEMRRYLYSQFELKKMPLVNFEERVYPMSLNFLLQSIWTGPYYLVVDKLREIDEKPHQFFHYLGEATHVYADHLLRYTFGRKYKRPNTSTGSPLGDGLVEINPNWHLVFEFKAKRVNSDGILSEKPLSENSSVETLFISPLNQISKRILEYRKSYKKRITPILVTSGSIIFNDFNWSEYKKLVSHLPIFSDPKITPPIFLDMENFEVLCGCVQNGISINEILKGKLRPQWVNEDFKSFLYREFLDQTDDYELPNKPLQDATHSITNNLIIKLKPRDSEASVSHIKESSEIHWKDVFKLRNN